MKEVALTILSCIGGAIAGYWLRIRYTDYLRRRYGPDWWFRPWWKLF